ncbi:c-type cytochrome [Desulfuromonas versatilis]|uniref:C-type cytochrome n=1 Tax=Desulfuromonas versatilis TaxID=2802975 RepID=A0ABN6E3Z2_9BACT|nr:cytochrome c3 family protein [Desulfuromonas versatilis]BCR06937.1 c-type cytochrome [Desulfuromonas versatilis]
MKNHVWRPLFVVIGLVVIILLIRMAYVPADFGVGERGYMYGFHRQGNEQEWKEFQVKYRGAAYCAECHEENSSEISASGHGRIQCENCHGAAFGHPEDPESLAIDRSRELCLRCHAALVTPSSGRAQLPGIDATQHNPGMECSECHNPHNPSLEEM